MIIYGDYHTHTVFTHGKGTIEDNVKWAVKKGLKQIAICEHSFSHMAYGIKRKDVPVMRAEIERLKKIYDIDILLGIESNIMSIDGKIDVTKEEQDMFDVIVVGYHKSFKPSSLKDFFTFFLPNTFKIFKQSKKRVQKNTMAYINAIKNNKIDILAHLSAEGCTVDPVEIAKVAKEYNTYIELNGKRIKFSDQQIKDMILTGVKFIINSDAHSPERVGENNRAFNIIEKYKIPHEQVANLDKIPVFKNFNNKN